MLSIIIPAKNEEKPLEFLIPRIRELHPHAELIVVDDGSTDRTAEVSIALGARVITHVYSKGNGAAIKTGVRAATGEVIVLMDADGQHRPEDIDSLLEKYRSGFHMVVGARSRKSQASTGRWLANSIYNKLATWIVGHKVEDLTSGFRVANARKFREFIDLLPNGFSYPTTSTMAFFRAGYSVGYREIMVDKRVGKSHVNVIRDGARFFLIIFKIGTLYSPLKLFMPISVSFFVIGFLYFSYTYIQFGRFTNMSALLMSTSLLVFLIGLVSEQITTLLYTQNKKDEK